jgi:hypothetical protein
MGLTRRHLLENGMESLSHDSRLRTPLAKIGKVAQLALTKSGRKVIQCQGMHPTICPHGNLLEFYRFLTIGGKATGRMRGFAVHFSGYNR